MASFSHCYIDSVISGSMPRWTRFQHTFGYAVMSLMFCGLIMFNLSVIMRHDQRVPLKGAVGSVVAIAVVAILGIGINVWFRRRIITEFTFDGAALRYQTLGISQSQIRHVSEIIGVSEWRGRGGRMGFRFLFRDGAKAYLQLSVPNSMALAEHLHAIVKG